MGYRSAIYYKQYNKYNPQIMAATIRKLPQQVINQISAGEVIQRPYNVIKQLVQNSIDAGSTQITVTIHQGGLKLIKICDNGSGIMLEDFPLLCARFATSKIRDFGDMGMLGTFGFRGQALASLSYVSTLVIASKYKMDAVGHSATFRNEKVQGKIVDLPMNTGTTITATDLFQKLQTRRASLNPAQQKKRIYKLLSHFCLHYPQIRISLLSQKGDQSLPRSTNPSSSPNYSSNESKMQIFQQITKLSYDKFSYLAPHRISTTSDIEMEAIITKINSCKGKNFMLNVNNRIVESLELFKLVERAYSECYQSIHEENQAFWVYLSIKIEPKLIDCNVDPTKKSVGLFASQKTYQTIKQTILSQIKKDSSIKTIKPPQKPPMAHLSQLLHQKTPPPPLKQPPASNPTGSQDASKPKTVYAFEKNRTDCKQLPITYFSQPLAEIRREEEQGSEGRVAVGSGRFGYRFGVTERDGELRGFFGGCSYVGCYGLNYVLIHYQNKLFMLNIIDIIPAFLPQFCQSNPLTLKSPQTSIPISPHLHKFLTQTNLLPITSHPKILTWLDQQSSQQLLGQTFGLTLKDGRLISYPCLGDVFVECLDLDGVVGWEVAYLVVRVYHAVSKGGLGDGLRDKFMGEFIGAQFRDSDKTLSPFNERISSFFRNRVIPILKTNPCITHKKLQIDKYMKQMLDLKDIYKIFQRC